MRAPRGHQRRRRVTWAVLALALGLLQARSQSDPLLEELKLPSNWLNSYEGRIWSGYKDNVLLSSANTDSSPLIAGGVDLTFYHIPVNGWEYMFLASGEYIRYLSASNVDQEATAIVQAQAKKAFGQGWKAGAAAEYVYFNQVFDASAFAEELRPLKVEGHGVTLRPSISKTLATSYRLELEAPATRQMFGEFIDDYWEVGPKVTFAREFGKAADLAFTYQFTDRMHDSREARDKAGVIETGRILQFYQHDLGAAWRQFWDAKRRWRTVTKVGAQRNEDNGGGYYNYWRPQFSEQVRYQASTWEIRADARVSYYHYDSQRVDTPDSAIRERTYLRCGLRGEKTIFKSLKVFAQYEYERAISNLDIDRYSVNTYSAGLDWEF